MPIRPDNREPDTRMTGSALRPRSASEPASGARARPPTRTAARKTESRTRRRTLAYRGCLKKQSIMIYIVYRSMMIYCSYQLWQMGYDSRFFQSCSANVGTRGVNLVSVRQK